MTYTYKFCNPEQAGWADEKPVGDILAVLEDINELFINENNMTDEYQAIIRKARRAAVNGNWQYVVNAVDRLLTDAGGGKQ